MKKTETLSPEVNWEIKDRTYRIIGGKTPLSWTIQTKHTRKKPLLYFDEEKTENREIRYATNQNSVFVDEQDGYATLGHVYFTDGVLFVPRRNQALQKLLSLYHPQAGKTWKELNAVKRAASDLEIIEREVTALTLVGELEFDHLEAILRAEYGSQVSNYDPKILKREGYRFAKNNPALFTELANDEDIKLRGTLSSAIDNGILSIADGGRTVKWGQKGKKIITIPFDETPVGALTSFVKTTDGLDVLKSIEAKLK